MRKRKNRGLLLSFCINMLWFSEWGVAALILWLLHLWLGVPLFISLILLGLWPLSALVTTLVLSWLTSHGSIPAPRQQNRNPYSARNNEVFPKAVNSKYK